MRRSRYKPAVASQESGSDLAARAVLVAAEAVGQGVAVLEVTPGEPQHTKIVYANAALAQLLGRSVEETLLESPFDLVVPEDRRRLLDALNARLRGEAPPTRHECQLRARDGAGVPVDLGVHLFSEAGRTFEVLLMRDLREQRAAEERARASERRFGTLVEAAPDGVVISRRGVVVYANPAGARILGVEPATLVGRSLAEFMSPEDGERMRARMQAIAQGQRLVPSEYRATRPDGRVVVAEIASIPIELDGAPAMLAFARDVTERASMQAELARADRLAALGRLAAGMAHEINNPLGFLSLSAESLDRRIRALVPRAEDRAAMLELVDHVKQGASRVASIVRDLKAFSREPSGELSRVDLGAVLDAATRMIAHELTPRGRLEREIPALPGVIGDAGRLEQVFVNLLMNAAQSLPEGERGVVTLRARVEEAHVVVEVVDTGVGIPPEFMERVFDPFFTMKPAGDGMGLGLSICHAIVRALGGEITIQSMVGRGTCVSVRLVRAPSAAAETALSRAKEETPPARRARILVVEDTPTFARMLQQILATSHEVTVVAGVEDAAAAIARADAAFDVILCDMMLRDGTGIDVFENARATQPPLVERFVFMTGGAFTPRVADFLEHTTRPRLEKPFAIATLERAIADVLR